MPLAAAAPCVFAAWYAYYYNYKLISSILNIRIISLLILIILVYLFSSHLGLALGLRLLHGIAITNMTWHVLQLRRVVGVYFIAQQCGRRGAVREVPKRTGCLQVTISIRVENLYIN